jgi:hypothetical protein
VNLLQLMLCAHPLLLCAVLQHSGTSTTSSTSRCDGLPFSAWVVLVPSAASSNDLSLYNNDISLVTETQNKPQHERFWYRT